MHRSINRNIPGILFYSRMERFSWKNERHSPIQWEVPLIMITNVENTRLIAFARLFTLLFLARSNGDHRGELMNSRNVRLPRIYLFILRSMATALFRHKQWRRRFMAAHIMHMQTVSVIWCNRDIQFICVILQIRVSSQRTYPTRLLNIHAVGGRDVINERKMMMYTVIRAGVEKFNLKKIYSRFYFEGREGC